MIQRITLYEHYVDYFKSIASGLKLTNPNKSAAPNFYEFYDFFQGNSKVFPAMILVPPTNNTNDQLSDNVQKLWSCDIWIMASVKREDKSDRREKLALCESIVKQIIAKMKNDYADYSLGINRPITSTDFNRYKWSPLGPEQNDNIYGYSLEFSFSNPEHLIIDSNMWW